MENAPLNTQANALLARAKDILFDPAGTWAKIAGETDEPKSVFLRYALPLAAIGPIASFIGGQLFGLGGFGITINLGLGTGLAIALVNFVMSLLSLWVIAFVAKALSPQFGGKDDYPAAFRLMAYSWTAMWVAGIFGLVPMLGILGLLAGLYSLYTLYKGVTPVMGVPQEKATGYTIVTVLVSIVTMVVVNLVVGLITAPLMMAGAVSDMSIDMGDQGSMETGADGTMTITGPDGEEVTIDINQGQSE